jgi:hypothetical protein
MTGFDMKAYRGPTRKTRDFDLGSRRSAQPPSWDDGDGGGSGCGVWIAVVILLLVLAGIGLYVYQTGGQQ